MGSYWMRLVPSATRIIPLSYVTRRRPPLASCSFPSRRSLPNTALSDSWVNLLSSRGSPGSAVHHAGRPEAPRLPAAARRHASGFRKEAISAPSELKGQPGDAAGGRCGALQHALGHGPLALADLHHHFDVRPFQLSRKFHFE